jgi:hypothetical protein
MKIKHGIATSQILEPQNITKTFTEEGIGDQNDFSYLYIRIFMSCIKCVVIRVASCNHGLQEVHPFRFSNMELKLNRAIMIQGLSSYVCADGVSIPSMSCVFSV